MTVKMNEFIAGLVGGTSGLIFGHPLDTIKAVMQTKSDKSMWESSKKLYQEAKMYGFFRGLSLPILGYGFINAIIFGTYGNILTRIDDSITKDPSLKAVAVAGFIGGFCGSIPNNPLEVIKLQLQTQNSEEIKGVYECAKQIVRTEGFMGFTKGMSLLLARDAPSYSIYFVTFETFRREFKKNNINNDIFIELIGGGIAGTLAWLFIIPIDVVKSRVQANYTIDQSPLHILKYLKRSYGFKGYYKGLGPVLLRAFLVNSVTFCIWKRTLDYLNQTNPEYINYKS